MTEKPTPLSPQGWLDALFASKAARDGHVIRRKARDIERFAGWALFRAELHRRGYRAVENSGQVVIFCNRAPIRPLFCENATARPVSFEETGAKSFQDFDAAPPADASHPLHSPRASPYIPPVGQPTMGINARGISGSDPGAVPGGSTRHLSLGGHGAETGSTNV